MRDGKELVKDALHLTVFADFVVTSDGHFLAQAYGDLGYNIFLGRPSFHPGPGKDQTKAVWSGMSFGERKRFVRSAKAYGLDPKEMLR